MNIWSGLVDLKNLEVQNFSHLELSIYQRRAKYLPAALPVIHYHPNLN